VTVIVLPKKLEIMVLQSNLSELPEELIFHISKFLTGPDLLRLAHVSRRLFRVLDEASGIWRRQNTINQFCSSSVIEETSEIFLKSSVVKVSNPYRNNPLIGR